MDLDYNLQVAAVKYAIYYLEEKLKVGTPLKEIAKEIGCEQSLISIYKKRLEEKGEIYGQ